MGSVVSGFYRVSEWIMRFAIVNILWLLFTAIGAVIFGIGPATSAMFTVVRKWLQGEEIPIFKTFSLAYKRDFIKANSLFLLLAIAGYTLILDYRYFAVQDGLLFSILSIITLLLLILYFITALYVFPVFVHYELNMLQYFRNAFLIAIAQPILTFIMFIGVIAIYYVLFIIPGLIVFFGISSFCSYIMWVAYVSISRVERANEVLKEKTYS
ncbi:YesL family protein [Gracilibacillus salinarum]|uniref:YesL family protein n=1 Tax=Gracilibacillus salinarum TaxID=2932255 RepID=A0ABY4GRD2_9BACI|nr:YesL family protein [Gracilibacillus salinarum]UOQ86948.1 YesL family protein [Gracilibacillus salinarum]